MKWTDATGYSQGKRREQTAWDFRAGLFRVFITKAHIYFKPRWAMGIVPVRDAFEMDLPEDATVEQAQQHAIEIFRTVLTDAIAALD